MWKPVVVSAVLVSLFLAGAAVVVSDDAGPNGEPDISGPWVGKVKVKGHDMSGEDDNWKDKEPVLVKVSQMGESINATIYVEEGPAFELGGSIGDGHFWMFGHAEEGPLMWLGHVKNKGKKLVGRLLVGERAYAIEGTIQLKRPKETDIR